MEDEYLALRKNIDNAVRILDKLREENTRLRAENAQLREKLKEYEQ